MPNFDKDQIITLTAQNGEKIPCKVVAEIIYEAVIYLILTPTIPVPGMNDGEAVIFELNLGAKPSEQLKVVTDEKILKAVNERYLEGLKKEQAK